MIREVVIKTSILILIDSVVLTFSISDFRILTEYFSIYQDEGDTSVVNEGGDGDVRQPEDHVGHHQGAGQLPVSPLAGGDCPADGEGQVLQLCGQLPPCYCPGLLQASQSQPGGVQPYELLAVFVPGSRHGGG